MNKINILSDDTHKLLDDESNNNKYKNNVPFEHIVFDNFFDDETYELLVNFVKNKKPEDYNQSKIKDGKLFKTTANKFAFDLINEFPENIKNIFNILNGNDFIKKLEKLTGIKNLIRNNITLKGAGFHKITKGGLLEMHTDFNNYKESYGSLDRRINILIYLNPNWKKEYGGELYLADKESKKVIHKILPIGNRCVIFSTTNKSVHGHPVPLQCSTDTRDSLALYYYTKNTNGETCFEGDPFHSTIYYNSKEFTD
jgi:Rps23 Pro-64 3,4-dihydroxylase Tpa1-like proline 4-hydroxylase